MSIFNKAEDTKKSKISHRESLTPQQVSDGKRKWQAFMHCIRENGIIDEDILMAVRENISKRLLEDSSAF